MIGIFLGVKEKSLVYKKGCVFFSEKEIWVVFLMFFGRFSCWISLEGKISQFQLLSFKPTTSVICHLELFRSRVYSTLRWRAKD